MHDCLILLSRYDLLAYRHPRGKAIISYLFYNKHIQFQWTTIIRKITVFSFWGMLTARPQEQFVIS